MVGLFNLVQQVADVVIVQARANAELTCPDLEGLRSEILPPGVEADPEDFINNLLQRLPRAAHFRVELGFDIIVQCQSGSHTVMLPARHHDVEMFPAKGIYELF